MASAMLYSRVTVLSVDGRKDKWTGFKSGRQDEMTTKSQLFQGIIIKGSRKVVGVDMNLSKYLCICFLKPRNQFKSYLTFV